MEFGVVYVIKNNVTGKYYVGQTEQDISDRIRKHSWSGYLLKQAFDKHGIDNFRLEKLLVVPLDLIVDTEHEYVIKYNSLAPMGYNILEWGNRSNHPYWTNGSRSEETKQKISAAKKGTRTGSTNPFYGKRHSPEIQAIINQKAAEWRATPEAQKHMAKANKIAAEKRVGRIVSEETRRKLHEANKGRQPSELARQRSRETKLGTKASDETKAKMSASHLGKKMPASHGIKSRENNINRITDDQKARVYKVREMIAEGKQNTEIARVTNLHYEMIRKIRNGTRYGWLE